MARKKSSTSSRRRAAKDLDLDGLKSELEQLRTDLGSLFEAVVDAKSDQSGTDNSSIRDQFQERLDQLQESFANARERSEQAVETAQHKIEERPLLSVVIAFGIGLLAGKFIGRG